MSQISKYGLWTFDNTLDVMIYNQFKDMFNKIEEGLVMLQQMDKDDYSKESIEYKFVQ